MEYQEAKEKFIQAWGALGSSWGINKAMGQIHALLLMSTRSLSTEEIMQELKISRGNANMNIRALIEWGIVQKDIKIGERKEFFYTNKDVWALAKQVARERKRREIEPIARILEEVQSVKGNGSDVKEFKSVTKDLLEFTAKADTIVDKFSKSDQKWFVQLLMKLMK